MEAPGRHGADGRARGATVGLIEALQKYFDRQLETRRQNGGKACPGEEVCEVAGAPGGLVGLRDKSRPIEAVCGQCPYRHTKPGNQPGHLSTLIVETLRLDELKEAGATFAYPDTLTPLQWAGLQALQHARAKDREKDFQSRKAQAEQNSAQAQLEARMGNRAGNQRS